MQNLKGVAESALFFDAPMPRVVLSPRRGRSLFTELISGSALSAKMAAKGMTAEDLGKKVNLNPKRIEGYMEKSQSYIASTLLDEIGIALRCHVTDLIPEVPLSEAEATLPLPKPPQYTDLAALPLPKFEREAYYTICKRSSDGPGGRMNRKLYKYIGSCKGDCGRTHFMFQSLRGKYMQTYTNIEIGCGAVTIIKAGVSRNRQHLAA